MLFCSHPAKTRRCPNVVLMLKQRRRRWPNIKTTLGQCLGNTSGSVILQPNVALKLEQHEYFIGMIEIQTELYVV